MNLYIYTDGGARGNPGASAIGVVILDENKKILLQHKEYLGIGTNNQAEYTALIKALELAAKYTKNNIVCFSDSELLVKQMNGEYKIKNKKLKQLFALAKEREKYFEDVRYNHAGRTNKFIRVADSLVNMALDQNTAKMCIKRFAL